MREPYVNISCPDGDSYKGEITVGGEQLNNVNMIEITMGPNSLVYAKLHVFASLTNVKALFDAFPIWESAETAPKDGSKILICSDDTDAQASWWIEPDGRWANWNNDLQPAYWAPMPRMME